MIGRTLAHFEITAKLGEGGMGEVYRARDTRLGRTVAIKILRKDAAESSEHLARFAQEARTVSNMDHPHICTLYDVGREEGVDFLVMQYVEGETLAERLKRGPLPIDEVFRHAIEIADALADAHRRGVVHRDLKPGNIILGKSGAMVLDFGLAKLVAPPSSTQAMETESPTEVLNTREGTVLGTAHYLTPEQLEGKDADTRSDIFSFGAVLYEMVNGRRAFEGDNPTQVMTAIMTSQPPASESLESGVPPGLERIIERCLSKDPEQRWQSAIDIREELKWVQDPDSNSSPKAAPKRAGLARWAWLAAGLVGGAAIMATLDRWIGASTETVPLRPARFTIELSNDESLHVYNSASVAFSPDGARIAYVANRGNERAIHVRALDELDSARLAGTERASSPIFSPDGEWIAFHAGAKLKKVHVGGGNPEFIANVAFFTGATWGPDDTIVYTPSFMRGLFTVSARGGEPRSLTTPDSGHAHIWPQFLPDGKHVIFTIWMGEGYDQADIALLSLETGKWDVLVESGFFGRYSPSGHLLYLRASTLFAVPFDPRRLEVTGPSTPVVEGVLYDAIDGAGHFAVSRGALVYAAKTRESPARPLVWVDRSGERSTVTAGDRLYGSSRISPDGERLAISLEEEVLSIWAYELARDSLTRVSFGSDDHNVAWSPDGKQVAFESGRAGVHQVYTRPADGSGDAEQITTGDYDHYLCDWSPDGRSIAYVEYHPDSGADLWVVDLQARQPRALLNSRFYEKQATFSPDGRWLAYATDDSGRYEVYVQPFPGPGSKWLVSTGGGEEPAWSRSGQELFFRSGGRMMAVTVSETPEFSTSKPKVLFEGLYHYSNFPTRSYDVGPDGSFVMVAEPEPEFATRKLEVVLNWSEELKQTDR